MTNEDQDTVLTEEEVAEVRALLNARSAASLADEAHISRGTLTRLLARLPTRRVTVLAMRGLLEERRRADLGPSE